LIIEQIASNRRNLFWTLAHIALGFFSTLNPFALVVWFYLILSINIIKSIDLLSKNNSALFLKLFSYLISFELLDRMAKTSPFLPFELGKYLLLTIGVIGIFLLGVRFVNGIIMVIILIPALLYDYSGLVVFNDIINNFFAPFSVGLILAFVYRLSITKSDLDQILKLIWLGCLATLIYLVVKTPDLKDIQFELRANFETTGGAAPNQISTILGLGMFLSFYSLHNRLKFSGNRIFDIILFLGFTFQGLLSFSRGGMLVGGLSILILIYLPNSISRIVKNREIKQQNSKKTILFGSIALLAIYGVFQIADRVTGGKLILRYQGETAGTLSGSKEVTVDHFVTGRLSIFEQDIDLWLDYFITGVGAGASRFLRDAERVGVSPHVELSRLLAEHGLLGLIYAYLFFFRVPLQIYRANQNNDNRKIILALLVLAIFTTFHAAMRTFVTPLFFILSSLKISESPTRRILNKI
jgi:hypothetical protein